MDTQLLLDAFEQYGYLALFLLFWFGVIGTPIPNEAIVMSGGVISTLGVLHPLLTFLVTYLGVVFGFSTGYVIGRVIGTPTVEYLSRKKNWGNYINKAQSLIKRFGPLSLTVSYLIPVVRIIIPYIVGMNKMPFSKYALYSYSAGLVWTIFYFIIGRYFGNYLDTINDILDKYTWVAIIVTIFTGFIIYKLRRTKKLRLIELNENLTIHEKIEK